jgi:hypothetical protein
MFSIKLSRLQPLRTNPQPGADSNRSQQARQLAVDGESWRTKRRRLASPLRGSSYIKQASLDGSTLR